MKLEILDTNFEYINTKERVTVADSFVVRQNKIGSGNGEAKLYIGQDNNETEELFGPRGFNISCFLLKKDLIKYLEETKVEYLNPEQPYLYKENLSSLWFERKSLVESLDERIDFWIADQYQIEGPRVYVNSSEQAYKIIRQISLPNITYISIVKLKDELGELQYYFRLFADYFGEFGEVEHPYREKEIQQKEETASLVEKQARKGQGKYREEVFKRCLCCPITTISDDRLLEACHIKPYSHELTNNDEKIDPFNGLMLTPTIHWIFDRGYLSFTDDKRSILSPFLSNMTYSMLGISDDKTYKHLQTKGSEKYLEFHRDNILKR